MIRQDFEENLPPRMFLEQIMDTVAKTYCFLWDKKDEDNRICLTWKELAKYSNKNSFRNSIRKLSNQGLINYNENDMSVAIELVGWEDI